MKNIEPSVVLNQFIELKEAELLAEGRDLQAQFDEAFEMLKPINFINDTLKDVFTSPKIKNNLINSTIGFSAGLIANKLFMGKSSNPFKKLTGVMLEMLIARKVTRSAENIKAMSELILKNIVKQPHG